MSTIDVNLIRLYEFIKFVFRDNLGWDFLRYLVEGGPRRARNGLELAHQSSLYHRLTYIFVKSSELVANRYLSIGDLSRFSRLLGLDNVLFIDDYFCCVVRNSVLCSPKEHALSLAYQARQIFLKRVYGSPTNSLVIDIGAWVGDSSIYFAKLGNYVVAIEPITDYVRYIHLNAKLNNVEEKVNVVNAAYPLTSSKFTRIEHRGTATIVPSGLNNIKYIKLSDILCETKENMVYLKVDCEGCEYDLINELIPKYVDVVYGIAMEVHKEVGDYPRLLSKLSRYYRLRRVVEDDYIMIIQLSRKTESN